jgi:hypothetical protein
MRVPGPCRSCGPGVVAPWPGGGTWSHWAAELVVGDDHHRVLATGAAGHRLQQIYEVVGALVLARVPGVLILQAGYSLKAVRARENALNEQAEQAYRQLVADWQAKAPKRESGVAAANGARLSRPSDGQQLRGRTQPQILRFARGSTTPTAQPNAR